MERSELWLLKLGALALGIAGWATYLLLWLGIRIFGQVTLDFGEWGQSWLAWFEHWVEPLVLLAWLAFLAWAFWHEFKSPTQGASTPRGGQAPLIPPSRSGRLQLKPLESLETAPVGSYAHCPAAHRARRRRR